MRYRIIAGTLCIAMLSSVGCADTNAEKAEESRTDNSSAVSHIESTVSVPEVIEISADADISADMAFDPYATENRYDIAPTMFERHDDVDYGTVIHDAEYYSTTAGDVKQCNILLPAGYDDSKTYPVMYVIHGWGGHHANQIDDDGYLTLLYGNMLSQGLTVPMIIVNVDMYTDKQADKDSKTQEEMRLIYDKVVDDIVIDLMPFMEKNYPVKTGRENTAVAGVSQGGSEALTTGFKWLDKFGYISGFGPDTGVIPTEYYKGTYWNWPYFEEFPMPTEETTPYYLYMSVGSNDPYNVEVTQYYSQVLDDMGIKNQTDLVEGYEHNYLFWRQSFYNYLTKIFTTEQPPAYKQSLGDINGDFAVDIEDAVMVIDHINGVNALNDEQEIYADTDKSTKIDIEDAVRIIDHVNGVRVL